MNKHKIGIIGYGDFTKVLLEHLEPYAEIVVSSRSHSSGSAQFGAHFASLEEVLSQPVIIPCIPSQYFEEFFTQNKRLINPKALVVDVCSVKVKPLRTLEALLPKTCGIVGTHPMFGPASVRKNGGITGLRFVLCPVRVTSEVVAAIEELVSQQLKLTLLKRTPEQHDQEMAYVQGLSHYIARVMEIMNIPESELATVPYEDLLDMKNIQAKDTWDLFESIMHENPFALEINEQFKKAQIDLDSKLSKT